MSAAAGVGEEPEPRRGASGRVRIELELEVGSDPISGTIRDHAGAESPFSGWIELVGELERASTADPRAGDTGDGP